MKMSYNYQYKNICNLLKDYIFEQFELVPGEEEEGSENEALVNFIKKENNFVHLFELAFMPKENNWEGDIKTDNSSQTETGPSSPSIITPGANDTP